jgi:hypothetical protein
MPSTAFEPATPDIQRQQTYTLEYMATEIECKWKVIMFNILKQGNHMSALSEFTLKNYV